MKEHRSQAVKRGWLHSRIRGSEAAKYGYDEHEQTWIVSNFEALSSNPGIRTVFVIDIDAIRFFRYHFIKPGCDNIAPHLGF